jgi:hypothetical protein
MTSTFLPPAPSPTISDRRGPMRVIALVLGALLLLPGVGLIAAGGVLLWAHGVDRSDGFVVSPEDHFTTSTHALISDRIDLRTGADWLPVHTALGDARVEITPHAGQRVFVGIARVADAEAYLRDVSRTRIQSLGFDSPIGDDDQRSGSAEPAAPGDQGFWIAQSSGTGVQRVTWPAAEGDWMFVIMNADGSAGIDVSGRIGAEFPALGTVAWTVLIIGVGVTAVSVLLIRPRRR